MEKYLSRGINQYRAALYSLADKHHLDGTKEMDILLKLVVKENPLKPYYSENGYRRCRRCHFKLRSTNGTPFRYCSYCGQRVGREKELLNEL